MVLLDAQGNDLTPKGRKLVVHGGPMHGTVLTWKNPEKRLALIPIVDDKLGTRYMMFERKEDKIVWLGWSDNGDDAAVTFPAGTSECKNLTNQFRGHLKSGGFTIKARSKRDEKKDRLKLAPNVTVVKPEDLGGSSEDPYGIHEDPE